VWLGLSFGLNRREKLGRHHLHRALEHPLTDARDRAANLYLAAVANSGNSIARCDIQIPGALQEAWLSLAIHNHSKMTGRLKVFEPHVSGEHSFD
jgi:hypothetical protein